MVERESTPTHSHKCGPSLTSVTILAMMHVRGKATLMADYIIDVYSLHVRLHTVIGYFILADIFVCNTVQASFGDSLSVRIFLPNIFLQT